MNTSLQCAAYRKEKDFHELIMHFVIVMFELDEDVFFRTILGLSKSVDIAQKILL